MEINIRKFQLIFVVYINAINIFTFKIFMFILFFFLFFVFNPNQVRQKIIQIQSKCVSEFYLEFKNFKLFLFFILF